MGITRKKRIKTFAGTFSANTSPDISFRTVTTSSKAWRYSYVALFLCDHFGEYLDDVLYISKKGKPRTIKIECYRIVTRMLARGHRAFCRCQCFEFTKEEPELVYEYQTDEEQDFSRADEIAASLNLTENMSLALDYRMSGLSYPEIAKQLSRAVSTVYEYFEKMRARYSAIYG